MERTSGDPQIIALATVIRALRHQRGLTEEALAAGIFSERYVIAVELGAVRPSVPALEALARRLDAPVSEMIAAPSELSSDERDVDYAVRMWDSIFAHESSVARGSVRAGSHKLSQVLKDA